MHERPLNFDSSISHVLNWALRQPGACLRVEPETGHLLLGFEPALAAEAWSASEAVALLQQLDHWIGPGMAGDRNQAWAVMASYDLAGAFEQTLPSRKREGPDFPLLTAQRHDWLLRYTGDEWLVLGPDPDKLEARAAALQRRFNLDLELTRKGGTIQVEPDSKVPAWVPNCSSADGLPAWVGPVWEKDEYTSAFAKVKRRIKDGDYYVTNLTQRFIAPGDWDDVSLWLALRKHSPAPHACFIALTGGHTLISSSPERFIRVQRENDKFQIETCPIKGTRPVAEDPEEDARLREQLAADPKERAELTMVVDLKRNDLSRICAPGTVVVTEHCALTTYRHVHHLASRVQGGMFGDVGFSELLGAVFPGGSVTGCPKISAIASMTKIEPHSRGPYTGAVFWTGGFLPRPEPGKPQTVLDSSILIRTLLVQPGLASFHTGGGIVADSECEAEYAECFHKARGMLAALAVARGLGKDEDDSKF